MQKFYWNNPDSRPGLGEPGWRVAGYNKTWSCEAGGAGSRQRTTLAAAGLLPAVTSPACQARRTPRSRKQRARTPAPVQRSKSCERVAALAGGVLDRLQEKLQAGVSISGPGLAAVAARTIPCVDFPPRAYRRPASPPAGPPTKVRIMHHNCTSSLHASFLTNSTALVFRSQSEKLTVFPLLFNGTTQNTLSIGQ